MIPCADFLGRSLLGRDRAWVSGRIASFNQRWEARAQVGSARHAPASWLFLDRKDFTDDEAELRNIWTIGAGFSLKRSAQFHVGLLMTLQEFLKPLSI